MVEFAPGPIIGPKEPVPVKKIEPVVSSPAKVAKKSEFRRVLDLFLYRDGKNIQSYLVSDVLKPAGKKAISDIARSTINTITDIILNSLSMAIWGEPDRIGKGTTNASKVSYQQYYDRSGNQRRDQTAGSKPISGRFNYDDILFLRRTDAMDVLDRMNEILDQYQLVSVSDLYELADIKSEYTSNNYGWSSLSAAAIIPAQGGYILKLPRPVPIN